MVGFADVICNRFHTTTLKCVSCTGSLYAIKADEFLTKFQRDPNIWETLRENAKLFDENLKKKIKLGVKTVE